jgi:hypothetical protein
LLKIPSSMRGLQWWNSGDWTVGDPDAVIWTSRRALRRARMMRRAKVVVAVAVAAVIGVILLLVCARRGFAPGPEAGIQVGACPPVPSSVRPL